MDIKFNIRLTKSQKEAYKSAHRAEIKFLTLVWSRQSGKSTLMKILCIEKLFRRRRTIGYVCRNYLLAKKLYKDVLNIFPKEYLKTANASDLIIESVYGSTLQFYSSESGDSLRGITLNYLILDEFAFFANAETLWNEILFPTIKVSGVQTIFVSTPNGKNNLFYQMYLRGISKEYPQYHSILKTIEDDGLITAEDTEMIQKQIPELSFRQEFLCEFLDSALTFFTGFEDCFQHIVHNYKKTWIGIDLSGDGKDETILTKINEDNVVEQFKIVGTLDQKYTRLAEIINNTVNLQSAFVEINGLGSPMLNEIRKLVKDNHKLKEWTTSNSSKEEIISDLAVCIANKNIIFDENDKELYSQFGTFVCKYSKTGKLQFAAQNGFKDDRIMSLAIALKAKKSIRPALTKNDFAFIDSRRINAFN